MGTVIGQRTIETRKRLQVRTSGLLAGRPAVDSPRLILLYGTGGDSLAERVVDMILFVVTILWFGMISA